MENDLIISWYSNSFEPNGKGTEFYWYRNKYKVLKRDRKTIRDNKLKELSKDRTIVDCIINPLNTELVYKEKHHRFNSIDNAIDRQEQFRLYYLSNDITIEELRTGKVYEDWTTKIV